MKQDEYNENELKRMEDELRSYGIPYSSNEPDDRYWANFRVRLNETIDATEAAKKRSFFALIAEWFAASAFRGIAVGAAAVVIVIGSVLIFRPSDAPVVATNTVVPTPNAPQVTTPVNPPATGSLQTITTPHVLITKHPAELAAATVKKSVKNTSAEEAIADAASDPSKYDPTLSPGNAEEPVDYSTLSEEELRSVLADISTIPNE